jgi:hypothetical protein
VEGTGPTVLTPENIMRHYGRGVEVIDHGGRPTVIPSRDKPDDSANPSY